jgi:hypothetical protein
MGGGRRSGEYRRGEWGEVTQTGFRAQLTMVGGAVARALLLVMRTGRCFGGRAHPLRCLRGPSTVY